MLVSGRRWTRRTSSTSIRRGCDHRRACHRHRHRACAIDGRRGSHWCLLADYWGHLHWLGTLLKLWIWCRSNHRILLWVRSDGCSAILLLSHVLLCHLRSLIDLLLHLLPLALGLLSGLLLLLLLLLMCLL